MRGSGIGERATPAGAPSEPSKKSPRSRVSPEKRHPQPRGRGRGDGGAEGRTEGLRGARRCDGTRLVLAELDKGRAPCAGRRRTGGSKVQSGWSVGSGLVVGRLHRGGVKNLDGDVVELRAVFTGE